MPWSTHDPQDTPADPWVGQVWEALSKAASPAESLLKPHSPSLVKAGIMH